MQTATQTKECKKIKYAARKDAVLAAKRLASATGEVFDAYRCNKCQNCYHAGHSKFPKHGIGRW